MVRKTFIELDHPILRCKKAGDMLYMIAGKELIKVDITTASVAQRRAVFPENSRTRELVIDGNTAYCRDFYRLYKVDLSSLEIVDTWNLGSDLSSDICAVDYDEYNVYVSIRNGGFAVIAKSSGEVTFHSLSQTSIWEMIVDDKIYAGNVGGELLVIAQDRIAVVQSKALHKKNLKSLLLEGDVIYTASQDLSIAKVDKVTLELVAVKKRCHQKMFYLAGIWENYLLTVSPPCGEMKVWHKTDLALCKMIPGGTWDSFIDSGILWEIQGKRIVCSDLSELIS